MRVYRETIDHADGPHEPRQVIAEFTRQTQRYLARQASEFLTGSTRLGPSDMMLYDVTPGKAMPEIGNIRDSSIAQIGK